MKCRHCNNLLTNEVIDLGFHGPSNALLENIDNNDNEKEYSLKVYVCEKCWLVQTIDLVDEKKLFDTNYVYFSAYSSSWLIHCKNYVAMIVKKLGLSKKSLVYEVASNDGYLLKNFLDYDIPCIGVEPTSSTAKIARQMGVKTIEKFFGKASSNDLIQAYGKGDLVIANNVLAHVPDINDFLNGFELILKDDGIATFEFPHLLQLLKFNQFDTIYHEHFSYLSLISLRTIFEFNGLHIFQVEEIPTHGGSLRIYAQRKESGNLPEDISVSNVLEKEKVYGLENIPTYKSLQSNAKNIVNDFYNFIKKKEMENKKIGFYGAAAKGNTFINYAKLDEQHIRYIVDLNPNKIGKYTPSSNIPIVNIEVLTEDKPDYIIILPWNLKTEIISQLRDICDWNPTYVCLIPNYQEYK